MLCTQVSRSLLIVFLPEQCFHTRRQSFSVLLLVLPFPVQFPVPVDVTIFLHVFDIFEVLVYISFGISIVDTFEWLVDFALVVIAAFAVIGIEFADPSSAYSAVLRA